MLHPKLYEARDDRKCSIKNKSSANESLGTLININFTADSLLINRTLVTLSYYYNNMIMF